MIPASLLTAPDMNANCGRHATSSPPSTAAPSDTRGASSRMNSTVHAAVIAPNSAETSRIAHSEAKKPLSRAAR